MANRFNTQEIVPVAGGGTHTVDVDGTTQHVYICPAGAITLSSALNINASGTAKKYQYIKFVYCGTITSDTATGKSVNIFGTELSNAQALYEAEITAFYNGTAWEIRIYSDDESGNVALEGSDIVAGTVDTSQMADNSITLAKMADITRGQFIVGGTADAPTYLDAKTSGQLLLGDGTDLASVAMSGDITISSAGVTTIGAGKVTDAMLATTPTTYTEYNSALSTANVLNMDYGGGNAIEILGAPGANKLNVIVRATAFLDYNSATYAAGGDVVLTYGSTSSNPIATLSSSVVTGASDTIGNFDMEQIVKTSAINSAIFIGSLTAAFTTGDSPLKLSILYYTVDFS